MLILGIVIVVASYASMLAGLGLVAYASNSLRVAVGRRYPFWQFLVISGGALVSNRKWREGMEPSTVKAFEFYARRVRLALVAFAVPLVLACSLGWFVAPTTPGNAVLEKTSHNTPPSASAGSESRH